MIIYKTTNKVNGKIYIGQSVNNRSSYLGSGLLMLKAIKKYGRQSFSKEILETCGTQEELNEREVYWIAWHRSREPQIGYNIAVGGSAENAIKGLTAEQRERFQENSRKADPKRSESLKAYFKIHGAKPRTEEENKAHALRITGKRKPVSEEHRLKIIALYRGTGFKGIRDHLKSQNINIGARVIRRVLKEAGVYERQHKGKRGSEEVKAKLRDLWTKS